MKFSVKLFILIIIFSAVHISVKSQDKQKFTISGYVKDASNGEYSIGANVYIKELKKGASTNQYGFYSITVEKGTYTLVASYVGYEDFTKQIVLDKDLRINIELKTKAITTQVVEITSEKSDKNICSTYVGSDKLELGGI